MVTHQCEFCEKSFTSVEKYQQHKMNKHNIQTYSDIILLDETNFLRQIISLMNNSISRDLLLEQMIEHEERTHSLAKSQAGREIKPSHEKIYSLFVPETSANTKDVFQRTCKATGIDLVKEAMLAKAMTDWGIYGKK